MMESHAIHVLTFSIVFALLTATVQNGIAGGDSGELVSEACANGIAHPPGYPLYINVLHILINFFPNCSPALVSNYLSCLFAAFAAMNLSFGVELILDHYNYSPKCVAVGCLSAGIGFATMHLQWLYSIGSEVFSLNNCLCSWIIYLFIKYMHSSTQKQRKNTMMLGAFVSGLCLCNQHTSILFLIILIISILWDNSRRNEFSWFLFLQLLFAGGTGLAPYFLLYRETITVGSWGDTSTLGGLVNHVLRREYGTFSLSPGEFDAESSFERTVYYFSDTRKDVGLTGYILALGGISLSVLGTVPSTGTTMVGREKSPFSITNNTISFTTISIVTCFVFYLLVFHCLSNLPLSSPMPYEVHRRFWMQPNLIVSFFIGIGVCHGLSYGMNSFNDIKMIMKPKNIVWTFSAFVKILVALALPFYALGWSARCLKLYNDMKYMSGHDGRYFQRYGIAGLASVSQPEQKTLLVSTTDINWNSMRYLQTCESFTPNVTHVSLQIYPFPWFKRQQHLYTNVVWPDVLADASMTKGTDGHRKLLYRFINSNLNQFPNGLFLDMHGISHHSLSAQSTWQGLLFLPHGLLWQIKKATLQMLTPKEFIQWKKQSLSAHERVEKLISEQPATHIMFPGSWEEAAFHISIDALYQRALFEVSYAVSIAGSGWLIDSNKPLDERQTYFVALRDGFAMLKRITQIFEVNSIKTNLNELDVQKNFALVSARYSFFVATQTDIGFDLPSVIKILSIAVQAVEIFLRNNPNDASANAFSQILPVLKKVKKEEAEKENTRKNSIMKKKKIKKVKKVKKVKKMERMKGGGGVKE
jgi:hypothetical protein